MKSCISGWLPTWFANVRLNLYFPHNAISSVVTIFLHFYNDYDV